VVVEAAEEGLVVVVAVAGAHRRHPPVDTVEVEDVAQRGESNHCTAISIAFYVAFSPPPTLEPEPTDEFEFGVTLYYGGDKDSIRLPRKFAEVVDEKTNQLLMRVRGGATGY
jgi:hypothetical protein